MIRAGRAECLKEIGPPPEKLLFSGVAAENAPAEMANYPTLVPQVPIPKVELFDI